MTAFTENQLILHQCASRCIKWAVTLWRNEKRRVTVKGTGDNCALKQSSADSITLLRPERPTWVRDTVNNLNQSNIVRKTAEDVLAFLPFKGSSLYNLVVPVRNDQQQVEGHSDLPSGTNNNVHYGQSYFIPLFVLILKGGHVISWLAHCVIAQHYT